MSRRRHKPVFDGLVANTREKSTSVAPYWAKLVRKNFIGAEINGVMIMTTDDE